MGLHVMYIVVYSLPPNKYNAAVVLDEVHTHLGRLGCRYVHNFTFTLAAELFYISM